MSVTKLCKVCKITIPEARLEALPDTVSCVGCSAVQPYRALISGTTEGKQAEIFIEKAGSYALELACGEAVE